MSWEEIKRPLYEKWKKHWFDTHPHNIAEYSWNYLFTGGNKYVLDYSVNYGTIYLRIQP